MLEARFLESTAAIIHCLHAILKYKLPWDGLTDFPGVNEKNIYPEWTKFIMCYFKNTESQIQFIFKSILWGVIVIINNSTLIYVLWNSSVPCFVPIVASMTY